MARWFFLVGLVVSTAIGSWWTAAAVLEGDTVGVLLRFILATISGAYYIVLYQAFAPERRSRDAESSLDLV